MSFFSIGERTALHPHPLAGFEESLQGREKKGEMKWKEGKGRNGRENTPK